ncbi:MAG: endonuclease/exonuclease/phosphatase [Geminicoccaceae bacterium]|nr:endonuclease/exonuclease/phosphatase [Geminicoccaceae bacterium]
MLPLIGERATAVLVGPSAGERRAILDAPLDRGSFERHLGAWTSLFDRVEVTPPPRALPAPEGAVRIAFWNAERGKFLEPSARLLGSTGAAAHLLVELDVGMARSGQRHTARELARRLDAGCAFAVEFLELGLGDAKERQWHAGEVNRQGLHGAAILSPHRLERPAVVRLETQGGWFDGERGERRLGGRIAVLATLRIGGVPVTLASVHLESHSDPAGRAAQTLVLLDAIDAYAPDQPVLIGGDFNTCTIDRTWARGTGAKPVLDPTRLLDPVAHEPLFEAMAGRGYDFERCNTLGVATQRTRPDGTPAPPLGRIDWFFSRGLLATEPATIAAVDQGGTAISDHEVLVLTISPKPTAEVMPVPSC